MPISEARFRQVLGHLAGGVSVVTSRSSDGEPCGMTATAVCSVSLDPPLVLASLDRESSTHACVEASGVYAIHILSSGDVELALRFSGDVPDKFAGLPLGRAATGAPILEGGLGFVDCTVTKAVPAGDHTVFLGQVEEARIREEVRVEGREMKPLLYHLGAYGTLSSRIPEPPVREGEPSGSGESGRPGDRTV